MNSVWQQLTLVNLPLRQWSESSYLHHIIGWLRTWRQGSWLMRWADYLAAGLVAIVFGLAPFVSTGVVGVLLLACAGFWLLLTLTDEGEIGTGITPLHLLVLLYWGVATVATAVSPVRSAALEGWIKLTLYLLFFALMARVLRSSRFRSTLILVYLVAAAIVSVVGLRQWFFGASALATWVDPESSLAGTTRVYSFLGNPNLLAAYLLPATIFSAAAFFAWRNWLPKLLALTLWVVNSACLVLTFSRGGWIGYVAGSFVLLMLLVHWLTVRFPRFWRIWTLPIVLGVTALLVAVAVITVEPLRERVASIFVGREDSSNNFRINVWMAVIEMIKDRPWLGIGPGNDAFNRIYPRYQQPGYTALSAYSVVLEIAVETGLIGVACFLWLLLVAFSQAWQRIQQLRKLGSREGFWLMAAVANMVGMLAHGLVDTVWYRPQVSTLWWLTIALIASYYSLVPLSQTPTEAYSANKSELSAQ
ncbi:IctB family putative bicarbonate transporter [Thermocoleostomius sinensis]|uniref:IctB family putative bicarbonate transporter n=1 Tax=Thermocoleostomius sinensis A174 TaxID=2016057 RepID=A0A9E9CAN9_9CYAN|nr:IctB family putative bicarbonate transporter [Thermocoleostomius sinensis]WAL59180.1 IctB family putative bicarbonate transporter [Thermocoleostomius sinensis A174]